MTTQRPLQTTSQKHLKLLIVESPGKLKTLRKILGRDWILEASVGHTTELAHDGYKKLGFDLKGDRIETRYIPRGDRGKQVLSRLRAAVKQADQVYLAMDPDREGEAIAWHLVEQLRLKRYVRVCYTQITEKAVHAALEKPRKLDLPLVEAQRARQCLDKLVGYEVSPLLWNSSGGKSAGRVQSATLHLVCERERERLSFVPQDYWVLHSHYNEGLVAQYEPLRPHRTHTPQNLKDKGTDEWDGRRIKSEAEAKRLQQIAQNHPHIVRSIEESVEKRMPLPPLITSSLQQTAGVRLRLSPEQTMKIAQELYEGVNGQGLITYMRTDAVTLSPEFVDQTRTWLRTHAPQTLAERPPTFKVKAEAQGAHEAIRPTSVEMTPEKAKAILSPQQLGVYTLIWERAIASQCKSAELARTQVEIVASETRWVARGLRVIDPGYLQFWKNIEEETVLPALRQNQELHLKELKMEKRTTQAPPRYSEAKLVQLMEKLGIGRPSTYASTVKTLRERSYVEIQKGALAPTPLGMTTDEVLTSSMPDLVDVRFTAQMEESLDKIAENKLSWESYLCRWNKDYLQTALIEAHKRLRTNAPPQGPAPFCEKGHGPLVARVSKKGSAYWKCSKPNCEYWMWADQKPKRS